MGVISVRCRKCRHLLFLHPEITLFDAHGVSCSNVSVKYVSCGTIQEDNVWFLQDTSLPSWIADVVNNSNWTKGKVNCPNCQGRLGSFDFVSGTQCQCEAHVLPPVHIVKCKVDCRNQGHKDIYRYVCVSACTSVESVFWSKVITRYKMKIAVIGF